MEKNNPVPLTSEELPNSLLKTPKAVTMTRRFTHCRDHHASVLPVLPLMRDQERVQAAWNWAKT